MPTGKSTMQIDGYEAMVISVGYIFADELAPEMWDAAANHEVDSSRLINVDNALSALEDRDDLDEAETKLLSLLQAAEKQGLEDIIINVS